MESFLMKAVQLIVALVILVTIHEFGHYIFARAFGIKVNRFYLFFNPWFSLLKYYPSQGKLQIIAWTKKEGEGEDEKEEQKALFTLNVGKHYPTINKKGRPSWAATMYGLGWLPLGGYCDIAGMVDETKNAADLESEPQPWEFRSKAAWKRFMVMVAGVLFNFLLAIIIYAGIAWHWGDRAIPFDKAYEGFDYAEPLKKVGFQDGDVLLTVNGERANAMDNDLVWDMVQPGARVELLRNHADTIRMEMPASLIEDVATLKEAPMMMRLPVFVDQVQNGMPAAKAGIEVNDRIVMLANDTTPSITEFRAALKANADKEVPIKVLRDGKEVEMSLTPSDGLIGIVMRPADQIYPFEEIRYNALQALPRGWVIGTNQLVTYVESLKLLFTKTGAQQVGGFGTIGSLFPETWNWYTFWQITAFLSVILAFMNIIPIPGLDGGHVVFLLWEIVTRRKPSDRVMEVANTIGFAFLLLLLVYANGNDLFKLFR